MLRALPAVANSAATACSSARPRTQRGGGQRQRVASCWAQASAGGVLRAFGCVGAGEAGECNGPAGAGRLCVSVDAWSLLDFCAFVDLGGTAWRSCLAPLPTGGVVLLPVRLCGLDGAGGGLDGVPCFLAPFRRRESPPLRVMLHERPRFCGSDPGHFLEIQRPIVRTKNDNGRPISSDWRWPDLPTGLTCPGSSGDVALATRRGLSARGGGAEASSVGRHRNPRRLWSRQSPDGGPISSGAGASPTSPGVPRGPQGPGTWRWPHRARPRRSERAREGENGPLSPPVAARASRNRGFEATSARQTRPVVPQAAGPSHRCRWGWGRPAVRWLQPARWCGAPCRAATRPQVVRTAFTLEKISYSPTARRVLI